MMDVSEFERFVGDFYYEFSHLYNIIAHEDILSFVDDIYCKLCNNRVEFHLKLNNEKAMKKVRKKLNKALVLECDYIDAECHEVKEDCIMIFA
jgi:hypothetical protein